MITFYQYVFANLHTSILQTYTGTCMHLLLECITFLVLWPRITSADTIVDLHSMWMYYMYSNNPVGLKLQ